MQSIFDMLSTNNQQHSKKFQKEKLSIKDFFTSFKIIISRKYFISRQKWANKHNSVPYRERH